MTKVQWIIEADVFSDNEKQLAKEIKKQGMNVNIIRYDHFFNDDYYAWVGPDKCVVFYGSLDLGRKLLKNTNWIPGVYLKQKEMECSSYYPILGNMLVHSKYIMLPYGDLLRMKEQIFEDFFRGWDKVFVRPNSGNKEFTGMIIEKDNWEKGIELSGFYGIDSNMIVLISSVWALHKEWRFVVVDGKVITGSSYRDWSHKGEESTDYVLKNSIEKKEECDLNNNWDKAAWDTAQKCADKYNPDRCWTIDIVRTIHGTYNVLEIGCFSCAGLYGNNLEKVVKAVSNAAKEEWEEYFLK